MEIFAHHAHIYQDGVLPDPWNGTVDDLKKLMDECEISKAVVFPPFSNRYRDEGYHQNVWLEKQIKYEPNIVGFGVVDFAKGMLKDQVKQLADLGLKGVKIHPANQQMKIDSPEAFEVYAQAEELNLPVTFHTAPHHHRLSDCSVLLLDEVAWHFPNLRFTIEHVGGYSGFYEAMAVLINTTNTADPENLRTYAGLTSVFDGVMNKAWHLDDRKIKDLLWQIGPERCIFGLDSPWNDAAKIKHAIAKVKALDLTQEQIAGILGGNLKKLLGM